MSEPNRNLTNITPPRVPLLDDRTGLVSREWYRFFVNLFNLTGGGQNTSSLSDLQVGPSNVSSADMAELQSEIIGLQSAPVYTELRTIKYGAFYDTTTQTAAVINTAYAMTFNNTSVIDGVTLGTPTSRVICNVAGTFNFQFSAQLFKTAGALGNVYIWARINGVDQTQSASKIALSGANAAQIAAWNFFFTMAANDYFELMWSTDDTSCRILAQAAAAPVPGIPSVILTVSQVNTI